MSTARPAQDSARATPVGVDDGYAVVKVVCAAPDGSERMLSIPARVARGLRVQSVGGESIGAYETDGDQYTVSARLSAEPTRVDDFHTSAMHRVLVNHALIAAGFAGQPVDVACGLPVQDYYAGGARNATLIDAKKASLGATVAPLGKVVAPVIVSTRVYPQAIGAYLASVIDAAGRRDASMDGRKVAVLDIGGNTTDLAGLVSGETPEILSDHTRSLRLGVFDVRTRVRTSIHAALRADLDDDALDLVLRTGRLDLFGESVDVSTHVADATASVWAEMQGHVQERLGNGSRFYRVLLVGGGAALFAQHVSGVYRHTTVPPKPEFANAVGFFRYQLHVVGAA